jgi:hypothetical protein
MPFSSVKMKVSGDYNNPQNGTGYMQVATGANGIIVDFNDSDIDESRGQTLIVGGEALLTNDKTDLIGYDVLFEGDNDSMNNMTIKMRGDTNYPYCRRYVKMLAVK